MFFKKRRTKSSRNKIYRPMISKTIPKSTTPTWKLTKSEFMSICNQIALQSTKLQIIHSK